MGVWGLWNLVEQTLWWGGVRFRGHAPPTRENVKYRGLSPEF